MLDETRQALKLARENGPYVLVPHSMSGLEAIYWAQKYPLLTSEELSIEDKERLKAIFFKSSLTKTMLNEINYIQENARKVKENGSPTNIPIYFFIAEDSINIIPNWQEKFSEYVSEINPGKYKVFDSGHYLHHEKSDILAKEIINFLTEINRN